MVDHATIDFETYSELDVRKVGAWRYSEHPSTDVLCLAYRIPGEPMRLWTPYFEPMDNLDKIPTPLLDYIEAGGIIEAHNNEFERAIWENVLVRKYNFPNLPFEQCRCSAAKAAALALPRGLDGLGQALGLETVKDMTGNRLMKKISKPRKPLKAEKKKLLEDPDVRELSPTKFIHDPSGEEIVFRHEKPEEYIRVFEYCETDTLVEEKASEIMPDLSPDELQVWRLDQKINKRGIYCDLKLVNTSLEFIEQYSKELTENLIDLTNGEVQTPGQRDKILAFLESNGLQMPGLTAADVEKSIKDPTTPEICREVLEIRQALSKSSTKKFKKFLEMVCEDGRIRGTLLYHGASTGRWAGKGIQVQNLPRGTIKDVGSCIEMILEGDYIFFRACYPDVLGAISSCIRGALTAAPGRKLICADFSSIESRGLFWLADEEVGLEIYRGDGKIYEEMAAEIYNKSPDEILGGTMERNLGKQAVLGCGYGMGAAKFQITCEGYGMDVDKPMAQKAVTAYRSKFPRVPAFWRECEDAAIGATLYPGKIYKTGKVAWRVVGDFLYAKLPSGRKIAYHKPKLERKKTPWGEMKLVLTYTGVDSQTKRYCRQHTYGGKIVENITQAVARDFMAEAMLRIEDAGYSLIMSVHDELVAEVDEDFGSLEDFERLMEELPEWAKGSSPCPIAVEGWEGKRFKK